MVRFLLTHWWILISAFAAFFSMLGIDAGLGEALIGSLVATAVSTGLSIAASVLFAPKAAQSPISYPPNDITRGGYLPLVLGRRVVGCHIGWVGDRHSQAASHAGGSELTPQPSSGNIYFEGGWHQLCHGPVRRLYRIWTGGKVVSSRMLDSMVDADGAIYQLAVLTGARISDYYRFFFGGDPSTADAYLQGQTTIPSTYPGLCHIVWQRKNLGGAPQWPLMKYEIETVPGDVIPASGLPDIFTANGIQTYFPETNPSQTRAINSSGNILTWFNSQMNIPSGSYTLTYIYGAMKLNANKPYSVYSYSSLVPNFAMQVVDTAGTSYGYLPWNNVGNNQWNTQAEAEAANVGASISFTWPGGPMALRVFDTYVRPGMVPGLPNPTYNLSNGTQTYTCPVTVSPGAPGSGDSGWNPAAALWVLLCAPFPYGCGIPTSCVDQTALLKAATTLAGERLVCNVLVDQGRNAPEAIASLMSDIDLMMPQVGTLLTPYLIRLETTVPEITDALRVGAPPEMQRTTGPLIASRLTFQIDSSLNDYAVSDITIDNDVQATTNNRPSATTIKLENITSLTIAQQVAIRRAVEIYSTPHVVPPFETLRETRNPLFHPGRSFLMDGQQYRITSWKPDTVGVSAEIGAVLDQYGDTSLTFDLSGAGDNYVAPSNSPPEPDTFFAPFVVPRSEWASPTTPVFATPRVRANDNVSGAFIWISNASTGTYNQIGSQDNPQAGGLTTSAFNTSNTTISIDPYDDDIQTVPDLTGDTADYLSGQLTVLCESEIMLLESVTANMDGSYTLNSLTRGAFGTTPANHSSGTSLVIISYTDLTPSATPLLAQLSPAGGTLWVKTQPTDGNTLVDLSTVTPEPLTVPPNLLATITILQPVGGQTYYVGEMTTIQWQTTNLTGTLNIDVSSDGGATWSSIASGVADVGSYTWIPTTPSTDEEIRVSSSVSPTVYAISYPFTVVGDTVTPAFNVSGGPVTYFGAGKNYPPGTYTITYISGAISYATAGMFNVNGNLTSNCYKISYNGGSATAVAPGDDTTYSTVAACQTANAGASVMISHTGGTIGVSLQDPPTWSDNTAGPPAVTYGIS